MIYATLRPSLAGAIIEESVPLGPSLQLHPRTSSFITPTRTLRFHAQTQSVGYDRVYLGRYKSLPVESDRHFQTRARYLKRNAERTALLKKA